MNKIAIVFTQDVYYNYSDDHEVIARSITEWEEVSDTDLKLLQTASFRKGFVVVRQPTDTKDYIAKTVAEQIKIERDEEVKRAEEKKKREEAALARKHKKDLKDKESKLALLKKLKEEFGEVS